jgi:hypothetical protein
MIDRKLLQTVLLVCAIMISVGLLGTAILLKGLVGFFGAIGLLGFLGCFFIPLGLGLIKDISK